MKTILRQSACLFLFACMCCTIHAQEKINPDAISNKMQWFQDAKNIIHQHLRC
jgi:hypothetical protein